MRDLGKLSYSINTPPSHNNFVGFLLELIRKPIIKHKRDRELKIDPNRDW